MNQKKQYIEELRVISMLSVVLIHVCITALSDFPDSGSEAWHVVYQSVRNVLHFAVPIFFMISGALLLPPEKSIPFEKLIKKYVAKYTAVIVVFGWGFAFLEELFHNRSFKPISLLTSFLNMFQGQTWNHMWYMYSLLGVTLILPMLRAATANFDETHMKYFLSICFVFLSAVPYLSAVTGITCGVPLAMNSVYVGYMLLGYWIDSKCPKISKKLLIFIIIAGVLLLILDAYMSLVKGIELAISDYNSPVVFIFSAAIFAFARSCKFDAENRFAKIKSILSVHSFGVYIIHMLWINLIYKFLKIDPFHIQPLLGMLVMWAVVTLLSLLSTMVMRRIPLLKQLV